MRLLGFLPFLLIGVVVGIIATHLFNRSPITAVANCVLGIFAAVCGLFLRDLFDFESGILSGFVAATVASCVVVFAVNAIGPMVMALDDDDNEINNS